MQPTSPFHGRLQGVEQLLQVDDVPDALHFSDGWVEPPAPALWG